MLTYTGILRSTIIPGSKEDICPHIVAPTWMLARIKREFRFPKSVFYLWDELLHMTTSSRLRLGLGLRFFCRAGISRTLVFCSGPFFFFSSTCVCPSSSYLRLSLPLLNGFVSLCHVSIVSSMIASPTLHSDSTGSFVRNSGSTL